MKYSYGLRSAERGVAINFLNSDFAWLKSSGLELNFLNFAVESFLGGRAG